MQTLFNRKVLACFAVILILTVTTAVLYAGGFLTITTPVTPLIYGLTIEPTNASILQDQTLNATITANYLQGTPQNVELTAETPKGITCTFTNTSGTPIETNPFKSTLQITAWANATPGSYQFNINTTPSSITNCIVFTLTVLNSYINVSGTVTADFDNEIIPTEITFENTLTHEKFDAHVCTSPETGIPTTPTAGIIQTGRYSILLPNKAGYSVTCSWMRVPLPGAHFDRAANGSFYGGGLTVNCGVGADSLVGNNYDGGPYSYFDR